MRVGDLNWMQLEAYLGGDDRIVLPVGSTKSDASVTPDDYPVTAWDARR